MNFGFDAKRAFHNSTGLGHYSRTLISLLSIYYPENRYYLFNPKPGKHFQIQEPNTFEVQPSTLLSKLFRSAWRSSWVKKDLERFKVDLYHGLSHEIPVGISKTITRSIVTIHDLIHERSPEQYNPIDVKIYNQKYRYACKNADKIIATSLQTKEDIITFYKTDPSKIEVCYQSCSPLFATTAVEDQKNLIRRKYNLPDEFFLSVGTIIERKNLLNVCKAIFLNRNELELPLVVIGKGSGVYYQKVKDFILQNGLEKKIIFLSENPNASTIPGYLATADLPVIFQCASAMLYPSFFEGFGIPVMEALWSRLPVITSNVSCLPEVGGPAAYYVDPNSATEIAEGMKRIYTAKSVAETMRQKGWQHAQNFTPKRYVDSVMQVYQNVW